MDYVMKLFYLCEMYVEYDVDRIDYPCQTEDTVYLIMLSL